MSPCKSLRLLTLTARWPPCPNSFTRSTKPPILPFLYPSRSLMGGFGPRRRSRRADQDQDVPFFGDHLPAPTLPPAAESEDPWAFLFRVPAFSPPPSQHGTSPAPWTRTYRTERMQPNTTITEREREIFTKIFESILSERSSFTPQMKESLRSYPSPSLTALFESAVGPQSFGSEISFGPKNSIDQDSASVGLARASESEDYPFTLRAAAAKAAGLKQQQPATMGKDQAAREVERLKLLARLTKEMEACETDFGLGLWMDDQVFETFARGDRVDCYADLLQRGMVLLRENFNDLAGAMSAFERVKKMGAESYVVGCSVGVYNQIIETRWEAFRDVHKVVELLEEMKVNAIEGDGETVEVLRFICGEVRDGSEGRVKALYTHDDLEVLEGLIGRVVEGLAPGRGGDSFGGDGDGGGMGRAFV